MSADTYPVSQIEVSNRLRLTDPAKVAELAISIREQGLLQPVGLAERENGKRRLVFGAHRLAAFQVAFPNVSDVPFVSCDGSDDALRLMEIDENLYRHELTAADQAAFLFERSAIWQRIHGTSKTGRPSKRNSTSLSQLSFFSSLEAKFGLSATTIKRAYARRRDIGIEAWTAILKTPIAANGAALDVIAKAPKQHQKLIVDLLTRHPDMKAAQAADDVAGRVRAEPPTLLQLIQRRWPKLKASDRTKIARWIASQQTANLDAHAGQ